MRALVTRPIEDAAPLAEALKARGIEPVLAPLMTIRPIGTVPPLDGVAALLFTSANGLRAFAALSSRRDLACFTVGQATGEAARAAGFAKIEMADGNVDSLAALVAEKLDPGSGRLLHIAGTDMAGDLAGQLAADGFTVERAVLYEAAPVALLPLAVIEDIKAGRLDCVLLFSPRTASLFAERIRQAGLDSAMTRITALCLSKAVADAATLPFAAKRVAARPEQTALLELLDQPAQPSRAAPPPPPPLKTAPDAAPSPVRAAGRPTATNPIIAGALAGLLVASLVAALAIATAQSWMPASPNAAPAMTARLDALDRQLAQLKSTPVAAPDLQPITTRLAALEQQSAALRGQLANAGNGDQVAALQSKLGDIEQTLRGSADARTVADLSDRLGALTQQMGTLQQQVADLVKTTQGEIARTAEAATHRTALALAASQLGQAIGAGQGFAPALGTVLGLVEDPALKTQLAALQPQAERGIPTIEALARQFPATARDVKAAAIADAAGGGWYGAVRALLGRLVTIRATDPGRGGNDLDNRLARTQAYLDSRDLAAAVGEMKNLPAPAAQQAAAWLADAEHRLAADAAVTALDSQAVAGLTTGAR